MSLHFINLYPLCAFKFTNIMCRFKIFFVEIKKLHIRTHEKFPFRKKKNITKEDVPMETFNSKRNILKRN